MGLERRRGMASLTSAQEQARAFAWCEEPAFFPGSGDFLPCRMERGGVRQRGRKS